MKLIEQTLIALSLLAALGAPAYASAQTGEDDSGDCTDCDREVDDSSRDESDRGGGDYGSNEGNTYEQ